MSPNKRIFLNIVATYGRSLYALVIGLFTARWALQALGQVDYGLYGVVGGLTVFIAFLNSILATSIGRFYAFSVGAAQKKGCAADGLRECRRWFTVAVSIHTLLPLALMAIGYPLGVWCVRHYLTIPVDRVADCVWVFRFVCLSCFLSMMCVPFNAMYTAKQYIAELTIYSFITTTLNVCFLYYMITHPGVWLARFAFWSSLLSIVPSLIIAARACMLFRECRILTCHLFNWMDIRHLLSYAGWNFFGALGNLLKSQGLSVLVNKMLGPIFNATMSVSTSIAGHTQTLASAMVGAFMPAITNARGAEDRGRMISLVHMTCKFGAVLILPLAIPLALEVDEVMRIWLKNPPNCAGELSIWLMIVLILENMTTGHWVVVAANGKIAWYQFLVGLSFILTLPVAWVMMKCGLGIYSVGYALVSTLVLVVLVRIVAVKMLLRISPRYWFFRILFPIFGVSAVSLAIGRIPSFFMPPSFLRICVTTLLVEVVLIPLILFFVLDLREREFLRTKIAKVLKRL